MQAIFSKKVYNTLNRIQIADTILPKAFKVGEKMEQNMIKYN